MLDVSLQKQLDNFTLDVSFQVNNGITAILGPSGCGKSLTLQCLAGLQVPDKGKIVLHDRTLFDTSNKTAIKTRRRNIGYVFQNYALFPHLTVKENIAFGIKNVYKKAQLEEKVGQMIAKIQLQDFEKHYPRQLSGGQQQRVALGRTLITNPELLLLDEPFSALDHHVKHQLEQELLAIIQQNFSGVVLLVTHNMEEAYRLSDQIILLKQGRVIQSGAKETVFQRPETISAAQIIGCKNILPIDALELKRDFIQCTIQGLTIAMDNHSCTDGLTHIGIHAENIQFVNSKKEHEYNTFQYEIVDMISGINQTHLTLKVHQLLIYAVVPNHQLKETLTCSNIYLPENQLFLLAQ
ncbi:hypothetical protein BTR23_09095 [Alkalihalophilus pseudofirmus]|nr:hypothetical protein BTR23_09095 [Alkalihalophilus pseudofirmus]